MRIIYAIIADCDDPPDADYIAEHGDRLIRQLEDAVAAFIMDADASASVAGSVRMEW